MVSHAEALRSSNSFDEDEVVGYDTSDQVRPYSPRFSTSSVSPNDSHILGSPATLNDAPILKASSRRSRARAHSLFEGNDALYDPTIAVDALNPSGLSPKDLDLEEHNLDSASSHGGDDDDDDADDDEEELNPNQLRSKGSQGRGGWKMVGEHDHHSSPQTNVMSRADTGNAPVQNRKAPMRFQPLDMTEKIWMWLSVGAVSALTACGIVIVSRQF